MIHKINELKEKLDQLRPLTESKASALKSVFRAEETDYIYESNAIEGNTLTLAETELVLAKGLTVSGKPLKDHLEATNHQKAMTKLKEMVKQKSLITEDACLDLHEMVLKGLHDDYAGRYRDVPVRISGSRHVPPNPLKIPDLMKTLFAEILLKKESPVHLAADLHWRLSQIHPFIDGNGRTCRLMMNLVLMQAGYPLTIIRSENNQRVDYYNALSESDKTGDPKAFRSFIEMRVFETLERYLGVLGEVVGVIKKSE